MSNDPTLEEIPEDANQPATKADVRAAVDDIEQQLNSRFEEMMWHFAVVAENKAQRLPEYGEQIDARA